MGQDGGERREEGRRGEGEGGQKRRGKVRKVADRKSWIRDWHRKREREGGNDGE